MFEKCKVSRCWALAQGDGSSGVRRSGGLDESLVKWQEGAFRGVRGVRDRLETSAEGRRARRVDGPAVSGIEHTTDRLLYLND